jgi:hypothetical protein
MEKLAGATPTWGDGSKLNLNHADGFSIARGPTSPPLIETTIGEAVKLAATLWPEVPALISLHKRINWTYSELNARVDQLAAGLQHIFFQTMVGSAVYDEAAKAGRSPAQHWTKKKFTGARAELRLRTDRH